MTKTQKLYDSLKKGDEVYIQIPAYYIKRTLRKCGYFDHLLKAKVVRKEYCYGRAISIKFDVTITTDSYTYLNNALYQISKNKDTATKRYNRYLQKQLCFRKRQITELLILQENV